MSDSVQKKIKEDISKYGWSVIKVPADEQGPSFAYTIGLTVNYEHPELIICGLDAQLMHSLLNIVSEKIKEGEKYKAESQHSGVIRNLQIKFGLVNNKYFDDYVGQAQAFYKNQTFKVLQVLWPAKDGSFPGDKSFPQELANIQPELY